MKNLQLVGMESYRLPLSKKIVNRFVTFSCGDKEANMLLNYGHFIEVEEEQNTEDDEFGGMFAVDKGIALRSIPDNWENEFILLICLGGIGDCLIASNIITTLKQKKCFVTFAVGDNALGFCEYLEAPDDVVDVTLTNSASFRNNYSVIVDVTGYALSGPKTIVDSDFYFACRQKIDFNNYHFDLPKFSLPRRTERVRSRFRHSKVSIDNIICVHTEPTALHRKWPIQKWIELFSVLEDNGKYVMLLGKPTNEFDGVRNLTNCTDLPILEQLQVCNESRFFLGIDSAWAHISGLLRKAGLVIFAPSVPGNLIKHYEQIEPILPKGGVCRHRNYHSPTSGGELCDCISDIEVDSVINSLQRFYPKFSRKKDTVYTKIETVEEFMLRETKLGFFFPHVMLGGGETASLELCKGLDKYFNLKVVADDSYKPETNIVHDLNRFNLTTTNISSEIKDALEGVDVIVWYGTNTIIIDALRNMKKRPISIRVCHTHFDEEGKDFIESYNSYIDHNVCVSPVMAEKLNCTHIPNAINFSRLSGVTVKNKREKVAGFIGRLDSNKNIKWLIENIASTDHNLLVLGIDELYNKKDFKKQIEDANLSHRIEFLETGSVKEFYSRIDVLILPSKMEALPMVVMEAGYLGIPSIITDVGGTSAFLGNRVLTIDIQDGVPSLFDLKKCLNQYHKIDRKELSSFIAHVCKTDNVASHFRKIVRSELGKRLIGNSRNEVFDFHRGEGIGDVIMASSVIRKYAETFPTNRVNFYTSNKCIDVMKKSLDYGNVNVFDIMEAPHGSKEISYNESWLKDIHAITGMGGSAEELKLHYKDLRKRSRSKPKVGIMPLMNPHAKKKVKEWPRKRWVSLVGRLRKEGYSIGQLGHVSDEMVTRCSDFRKDSLQGIIDSFIDMDYIIAIEGVACHIAKALNKPIFVIQGNASSAEHTSYDLHTHVKSNTDCFCFASIQKIYERPCNIECMSSISVKRVLNDFQDFVKKQKV